MYMHIMYRVYIQIYSRECVLLYTNPSYGRTGENISTTDQSWNLRVVLIRESLMNVKHENGLWNTPEQNRFEWSQFAVGFDVPVYYFLKVRFMPTAQKSH